jgi:hypothetical protein
VDEGDDSAAARDLAGANFCSQCGAEGEGGNYCKNCGHKITPTPHATRACVGGDAVAQPNGLDGPRRACYRFASMRMPWKVGILIGGVAVLIILASTVAGAVSGGHSKSWREGYTCVIDTVSGNGAFTTATAAEFCQEMTVLNRPSSLKDFIAGTEAARRDQQP